MSPAVTKKGIRYRCDLCPTWFKTRDEAIRHEVNQHYGYSATMNLSEVL